MATTRTSRIAWDIILMVQEYQAHAESIRTTTHPMVRQDLRAEQDGIVDELENLIAAYVDDRITRWHQLDVE